MPTEIFESQNVFAPAFSVDADLNWGETHTFEVTRRKVEAKGTIADFIASLPQTCTLEGRVTAMTVEPALPQPQKLVNAVDDLFQLADKMGIVLVLNDKFNGYLAISSAAITQGVEDGKSVRIRMAFTRIDTTVTATATVPASRLRPKVKKVAPTGKKGGAAKGSKPTAKARTGAAALDDYSGRVISGFRG